MSIGFEIFRSKGTAYVEPINHLTCELQRAYQQGILFSFDCSQAESTRPLSSTIRFSQTILLYGGIGAVVPFLVPKAGWPPT